jgi:small subunit ribosomal protein S5
LRKALEKAAWLFEEYDRSRNVAEPFKLTGQEERPFEDTVVKIYRCAKVVKGGRRFSFGALVVVGNRESVVGVGYGKANEVPLAVEKGIKDAKKSLYRVPLLERSIPHKVEGRYRATKVAMIPANPGTGVIAGSSVRAVLELAGVQDVLTKVYGSTCAKNVVKATLDGLFKLRGADEVAALRGMKVEVAKKW